MVIVQILGYFNVDRLELAFEGSEVQPAVNDYRAALRLRA
jgi:hypothetical protein